MKKTIFEKSQKDHRAYSLPRSHLGLEVFQPPAERCRRNPPPLPEVSELDLTRHFSGLAHENMGIDTHFYPLGSCTMKFNPRVNEWAAALPGFTRVHPLCPPHLAQGSLQIYAELIRLLCDLGGMSHGSLTPNAGAQGELAGVQMIVAYHRSRGDGDRTEMLVPDNAHGTNPATARMAGLRTIEIPTNDSGEIDLAVLKKKLSSKTAGLMLTNPNTLGLFSSNILEVTEMVRKAGGLLYYDGANLNPILQITRPGDMGFDVMHINLHKTFSTPHGGGGPGAGPVLCQEKLAPFLPVPRVIQRDGQWKVDWTAPDTIGSMATFFGNFGIHLRAYLYIKLHGRAGLRKVAEQSVINANYLKKGISSLFPSPYSRPCMHEFVVRADNYMDKGVRALDIAKRLLDYGFHAPTIYFPLIVKEAMLIEPTETESKETLDAFVRALRKIVEEIDRDPQLLTEAPHEFPVSRLDEAKAVKEPRLHAPFPDDNGRDG